MPVIRFQQKVIVRPKRVRVDPPAARHTEVEHQCVAAVGIEQPVFGAAVQANYARAGETLAEIDREGAAEIGAAEFDPAERAPLEDPREASYSCFDFRKLGHALDMAAAAQAR